MSRTVFDGFRWSNWHHNWHPPPRTDSHRLTAHRAGRRSGDLWITELVITSDGKPYDTVSIMEFRAGHVVHETQYFAEPFEAAAWRAQWADSVQRA